MSHLIGTAGLQSASGSTKQSDSILQQIKDFQLNPDSHSGDYIGHPYAVGFDPAWGLSANKVSFYNSFKMKLSIIFGVIQMVFGVLLSIFNHRYFKRPLNLWFEFLPQLVFLSAFFGYMVVLVFFKWAYYSADEAGCAPSVLITLINMVLLKTPPACDPATTPGCCDPYMFAGQESLQKIFVLLLLICIPLMLFPKPLLLLRQSKKRMAKQSTVTKETNGSNVGTGDGTTVLVETGGEHEGGGGGGHGHGDDEPFDFGETFVHQAIHTIEYCLGTISHTASYLRLWALSLAHFQLHISSQLDTQQQNSTGWDLR
ncbi:unnamed protein product [Darwinula stevensoni]|uniref:V-type proton ATPase subunit a n=1 Tax=Darwinula stevensoni TaxID=69355 RepID=A0A7R9FPT5_9CRUS|nr:unnamed protein product [Darwinula stevensoni]CAG0898085.1 unnamed protein product [Darwinula stevensoni]